MGIQVNSIKLADIVEAERVSSIKAEAQGRIIAQLPSGEPSDFVIKQMNLLMLNAELDEIRHGRPLSVEEQQVKNDFITLKDNIKTIRDMSNAAELAGDSLIKFQDDLTLAGY